MAEEKTTEGGKKGGKLPIIIALVAVLAGGGFFGMKMAGSKAEEPKAELGEIVTTKEFLANLRDPEAYIRAEIAFHLRKDFHKEQFTTLEPGVRDAVNLILCSKGENEIATVAGKDKLKKEIAKAINKILVSAVKELPKGKLELPTPGSESKKPELPEGWDSAEGPVLKVYFTSIATQS